MFQQKNLGVLVKSFPNSYSKLIQHHSTFKLTAPGAILFWGRTMAAGAGEGADKN